MQRYLISLVFATMAGVSLPVGAQSTDGQPKLDRAVITSTGAYVALPPVLICAPHVLLMKPSPHGRYVLAVRQDRPPLTRTDLAAVASGSPAPAGATHLLLWDANGRTSEEVWKLEKPLEVEEVTWLADESAAFVCVIDPQSQEQALLRLDTRTAKMQMLRDTQGKGQNIRLLVWTADRGGQAIAISRSYPVERKDETVRLHPQDHIMLWTSTGPVVTEADLPTGEMVIEVVWDASGAPVLTTTLAGQHNARRCYTLDRKSGGLVELKQPPASASAPANGLPGAIAVRLEKATLGTPGTPVSPLWLRATAAGAAGRLLICSDAANAELLPDASAVIYSQAGAGWATPVLALDPKEYADLAQRAARRAALERAKHLGLALLMYAQDYDESLPTADGVNDKIAPYLGDSSDLSGFHYTYPGGALANISSPADTQLGFVDGPGGRATIYGDGHVRWQ